MKILTILGARPQFIKAATLSRQIAKNSNITELICHTGQHYDENMSEIFFNQMKIPKPDYFLGIGGKTHGAMTGQMMEKIEKIAMMQKPDFMLVYGDTNSTLAGALVASKLHIKLAHVEAGLRSFNMKMPEEINRILTDRVSDILFCPTDRAVKNLKNEGYDSFKCDIENTGDVMYDSALFYKKLAQKLDFRIEKNFTLCTVHRAENTDNKGRLTEIFQALELIGREKQIILPLHPRTKKIVKTLAISTKNITIVDPVGYLQMVWLCKNCDEIITDSGGLQKEAYFFKKPCITLRDETEWVELVEHEVNTLAGAKKDDIIQCFKDLKPLTKEQVGLNLYGDGKASQKIIDKFLGY